MTRKRDNICHELSNVIGSQPVAKQTHCVHGDRRSTTDAIFILKQTIEKYREGQKNIKVTFIDLEKTYPERRFGDAQWNEMCRKSTD